MAGFFGASRCGVARSVRGRVGASDEVSGGVVLLSSRFGASPSGSDTRGFFEGVDGARRVHRAARFEGGVTVGVGVGADAGLGK